MALNIATASDVAPKGPVMFVDLDNTLSGFYEGTIKRLRIRYPDLFIPDPTQVPIADAYPPEYFILVKELIQEPGFFASLPLIPGAVEGMQRLIKLGFHPVVCSSPARGNPTCAEEKRAWLAQHFAQFIGMWVVHEARITRDKHLQEGFAFIDDNPATDLDLVAPWRRIFYTQPYNRDIEGLRISGWDDPRLDEHLATALRLYQPIGHVAIDGYNDAASS